MPVRPDQYDPHPRSHYGMHEIPNGRSDIYSIGIDPGMSNGGLACLRWRDSVLGANDTMIEAIKMPQNEEDQCKWFAALFSGQCTALIEWINPGYKGTGKSSMSKLYGNYMAMRAYLRAAHIQFEDIKPHKWQQFLGIQKRGKTETNTHWKNRLKNHAQQLYPNEKITLATADALLIATVCRRLQLQGKV